MAGFPDVFLQRLLKPGILQKLFSILLLFSLTLQCFSKLGVIVGYEINKDYIANVLCVNRDKPEMHCNGKCYLKKKLKQDEQHKNNENGTAGNKLELTLFCATDQHLQLVGLHATTLIHTPVIIPGYVSPYFHFFRPPRS